MTCCSVAGCATHQAAQPEAEPAAPAKATPAAESGEAAAAPSALPVTAPSVTTARLKAENGSVSPAWFKVAAAPGKTFTFALKAEGDLVLSFKNPQGESIFYTMNGDQYPDLAGDDAILVGVESKGDTTAGPYELTLGFRD